MQLGRIVVAIVVAGVLGTLANTLAVSVMLNRDFGELAMIPGRYGVAIAVACALPILFAGVSSAGSAVLSGFVALTIIPSVLAKYVFGITADWATLFSVNAVYAVVAVIAYRAIAR